MNKLIRFYNQNKEQIFVTLLAIIIVIVIIQAFNNFAKKRNKENLEAMKVNQTQTQNATNVIVQHNNQSVISGTSVEDKEYKRESGLIEKFIAHCNKKESSAAYALLTDECKLNLYPTEEDFTSQYLNNVFASYKTYSIQNYYENTYKIRLIEDMLSTGQSNSGEAIQDYFTIVNGRLNINEYLGRTQINTSGTTNGIKISVLYKDVFMDYEKYAIEVYNGSNSNIKLDSLESTQKTYIENSNGIKYPSYSHEMIDSLIQIPTRDTRILEIKFYNNFVSTNKITRMVFSDIILNYDKYVSADNKASYAERVECSIGI